MKLLTQNIFERFIAQRLVSINEVVNSLYGLNPNTKTKDLPSEISEEAQDIKKAISRNIKSLTEQYVTISQEIDADLVFGAAFTFINTEITPEEVIERSKEAIAGYIHTNNWIDTMFAFGGRGLVDDITKIRKTGRGKHKKDDEESGTLKMMGLLIKLLAKKHPTDRYGTPEKPIISAIYSDVLDLIASEQGTTKGVGKSTFAAKARYAINAVHDD